MNALIAALIFTVTAPGGATYSATQQDFDHWMEIARVAGAGDAAGPQVFQLLTSTAWIEGEAHERGIVVSDAAVSGELETQLDQTFPSRAEFRRYLRESRQTVADVKARVRTNMLSGAIRDEVVDQAAATVTDEVVAAHHAEHGDIVIPERRDLRVVLARTRAEALVARRALANGANWRLVTRRHSRRGASPQGAGRFEDAVRGDLDRKLSRVVFRARPRKLSGPVRTKRGFYVFRVTRIHPERELSAALSREAYRDALIAEAQQRGLAGFVAQFQAKWQARTDCAPRYQRFAQCSVSRGGTVARRWNSALELGAGSPTRGR